MAGRAGVGARLSTQHRARGWGSGSLPGLGPVGGQGTGRAMSVPRGPWGSLNNLRKMHVSLCLCRLPTSSPHPSCAWDAFREVPYCVVSPDCCGGCQGGRAEWRHGPGQASSPGPLLCMDGGDGWSRCPTRCPLTGDPRAAQPGPRGSNTLLSSYSGCWDASVTRMRPLKPGGGGHDSSALSMPTCRAAFLDSAVGAGRAGQGALCLVGGLPHLPTLAVWPHL